jgi:hypothetical protein
MRLTRKISLAFAFALLFLVRASEAQQNQSPAPMMIVQAASASSTPAVSHPAENGSSLQAAITALQQVKAANEETLKKQQATLQQLDQLQKDAEQLKIFAKRG